MKDYGNPALFTTLHDGQHTKTGYKEEQYNKGLTLGNQGFTIVISMNGVWNAHNKDRSTNINSYEKIGYHACTADLLRGFIDSGTTIYAYDENGEKVRIQ